MGNAYFVESQRRKPSCDSALAPGHTTISAGDGSADITVYAGPTLPIGTIQWSIPGDGSGVTKIVPAVPSASGVADVFAFQADGIVEAITSDGTVAWPANGVPDSTIPDFQGGLITTDGNSVVKIDGVTGHYGPFYDAAKPYSSAVAHPDGTVFLVEDDSFVGVDPSQGIEKFRLPLKHTTYSSTVDDLTTVQDSPPNWTTNIIVAGDGYAYVAYEYEHRSTSSSSSDYDNDDVHVDALRIGTDGSWTETTIGDWSRVKTNFSQVIGTIPYGPVWCDSVCEAAGGWYECAQNTDCDGHVGACLDHTGCNEIENGEAQSGPDVVILPAHLITNADRGVLLSLNIDQQLLLCSVGGG